jgi:hypothetical protein
MVALIDNSAALMEVHEKLSVLALANSNVQGKVYDSTHLFLI